MKLKKGVVLVPLLLLLSLSLGCASPATAPDYPRVIIGPEVWKVSLATTPQEVGKGLGGIPSLAPKTGMLFDIAEERTIAVTTAPMLFSIDVIFISQNLMVTEVVQNLVPGRLILSQAPGRYFLEVNAGEAAKIKIGNKVRLLLPTPSAK